MLHFAISKSKLMEIFIMNSLFFSFATQTKHKSSKKKKKKDDPDIL